MEKKIAQSGGRGAKAFKNYRKVHAVYFKQLSTPPLLSSQDSPVSSQFPRPLLPLPLAGGRRPGRRRWGTALAAAAQATRWTSSARRSPGTRPASPPLFAPAPPCSPAPRSSTASPRSTSPPRTATSRYDELRNASATSLSSRSLSSLGTNRPLPSRFLYRWSPWHWIFACTPTSLTATSRFAHCRCFACPSPLPCCSQLTRTPPAFNLPQTALMLAAMHGKTDCVRRLLDAGANVSLSDTVSVAQAIKSVLGVGLLKWCFRFGCADRDVRFLARADVPALRGVLRSRGLPPDHPLGGQVRAGLGILVGLRRPGDTTVSPLLFIWAPC